MTKKILVGDTHGKWNALKNGMPKVPADHEVIVVGDFGYWPETATAMGGYPFPVLPYKVSFIMGNHENHDALTVYKEIYGEPVAVWPNAYYIPNGYIEDGILYIGGAASTDKASRIEGFNWFAGETFTYKESWALIGNIGHALAQGEQIHTVISHTCPISFKESAGWTIKPHGADFMPDPTEKLLQAVLEMVQPQAWYFGHWHQHMTGVYAPTGMQCTCLADVDYNTKIDKVIL